MTNGNNSELVHNVCFDTNALRSLNAEKDISQLLGASKDGLFSMHIYEPVIYERARQYYEANQKKAIMPSDYSLLEIIAFFKKWFSIHNVNVLDTTVEYMELSRELINSDETYFDEKNPNDIRDSLILSMIISDLPTLNTTILCGDKKLSFELTKRGYTVRNDTKIFIEELLGGNESQSHSKPEITRIVSTTKSEAINPRLFEFLRDADPDYFDHLEKELKSLPSESQELQFKLNDMKNTDSDLLTRILGYSLWFSPVSKTNLHDLLGDAYPNELVENNYQRLCIENLLKDTGNHLLPNDKNEESKMICEQAMSSVMDEILELLEA